MTAVLVFGAHGFLGRHAVAALHEAGARVRSAPARRYLDLNQAEEPDIVGVLRTERPDVVVNATGQVVGTPGQLEAGNVEVARRLVIACARGVPGVRLIHLGSIAEYGLGGARPLHEDDVAAPVSTYGASKLRATEVILAASARGQIDGTVLRVANPVGARQPSTSLLGAVAVQVRADPAADVVVGRLDGLRDLVSARDVGRAIAAAALAARRPADSDARLINVGSGVALSVRETVRTMMRLAGCAGRLLETAGDPSPRSAAVRQVVADVRRAERVLGWRARESIEQALTEVIEGAGIGSRVA